MARTATPCDCCGDAAAVAANVLWRERGQRRAAVNRYCLDCLAIAAADRSQIVLARPLRLYAELIAQAVAA